MHVLTGKNNISFSTDNIQVNEKFDYWHDVVCKQIVSVDCKNMTKNYDFNGRLNVVVANDVRFSEIHSDPSVFNRTDSDLANLKEDSMLLTMRLNNTSAKHLNKSGALASVGDIGIYHCGRAQELSIHGSVEALIMQVPIDRVSHFKSGIEDLNGTFLKYESPIVKILSHQMESVARYVGELEVGLADQVIDNFLRLLTYSLDGGGSDKSRSSVEIRPALLQDIIEFIRLHLTLPELSPKFIAEHKKISLRYLYLLFESSQMSPCQFIQNERLIVIARMLSQSPSMRISELAYTYGYNSVSQLSRVFKRKYGISPKEYRDNSQYFMAKSSRSIGVDNVIPLPVCPVVI